MEVMVRAEVDILAMALCGAVLGGLAMRRDGRLKNDFYLIVLLGNTILLLLATLMRWVASSAQDPWRAAIHPYVTFGYYLLACFPAFWWLGYVCDCLYGGKKRLRFFTPLAIPLALAVLMALANPFTGWICRIDRSNVYRNGGLITLFILLSFCYIAYSTLLIWLNRRRIGLRTALFLLLIPALPAICCMVQLARTDYDLLWPSVALSLTVLYFRILEGKSSVDYLTGLYNRMQADEYINLRIRRSSPYKTFSGILIDVDDFKEINDRFGHQIGDEALLATARLLRKNIGRGNFLARYGGDEFVAVLLTDSYRELARTVRRIDAAFARFSMALRAGYRLSVSMGFDVYTYDAHMTKQEFVRHIDRLMYREKRGKRERPDPGLLPSGRDGD